MASKYLTNFIEYQDSILIFLFQFIFKVRKIDNIITPDI